MPGDTLADTPPGHRRQDPVTDPARLLAIARYDLDSPALALALNRFARKAADLLRLRIGGVAIAIALDGACIALRTRPRRHCARRRCRVSITASGAVAVWRGTTSPSEVPMAAVRPVLLVHGAWHGAWCWERLLPHLVDAGLTPVTVELPSAGSPVDLTSDADVVRGALDALDAPAVVVGHSYGGIVISEATQGRTDVSHLVYLCAFMLDTGESLLGALGGETPPWIAVDPATGMGTVDPTRSREVFYADLDPGLAGSYGARLEPQSLAAFGSPLTGAGWHTIPSTYVACTEDGAIPYPAQQAMSARARTVHTLESSHSPFASVPEKVAAIVAGV